MLVHFHGSAHHILLKFSLQFVFRGFCVKNDVTSLSAVTYFLLSVSNKTARRLNQTTMFLPWQIPNPMNCATHLIGRLKVDQPRPRDCLHESHDNRHTSKSLGLVMVIICLRIQCNSNRTVHTDKQTDKRYHVHCLPHSLKAMRWIMKTLQKKK